MRIEILERELKAEKLEITPLEVAYLMSIKNSNPEIFKQLKTLIYDIDKKSDANALEGEQNG